MSVIPYTTDRHQMLIAVQEGGIRRVEFGGIDPIWVSGTGDAYRGNELRTLNKPLYTSHFKSCPRADKFRKSTR